MKQPQYSPLQVNEMALTLFGVNKGYYDDVRSRRRCTSNRRCART